MRFHSDMLVCKFIVRKLGGVLHLLFSGFFFSKLYIKLFAKENVSIENLRKVVKILEW